MFNLQYMSASLGVNLEMGGLTVAEEELTVGAGGNSVTLSHEAVAFDGSMIGWYRKPTDADWTIVLALPRTSITASSISGRILMLNPLLSLFSMFLLLYTSSF